MRVLSALILILASASAMAAPKVTITVRPECTISGAGCTMGDVASVQCQDSGLAQRVKAVQVCSAPLPGKSRQVTRDQLVIAARRAGLVDGTYDLLSPDRISVTRSHSNVTGQMLFDVAKAFVESAATWPGTTTVEPGRLPIDQQIPGGTAELRVRPGTRNPRKGQNSLPVEILVDGKIYRTVQTTVMVKVVAPILVATEAIPRSGLITSANTTLEERDITRMPDDVLLEMPSADTVASVPISQGAVVRTQCVSAPPMVKAGDSVLVVVESRGVRLADKGTAAQDGRPGDRIKVRMAGDVREIRGIVAEPGIVKIQIGGRTN